MIKTYRLVLLALLLFAVHLQPMYRVSVGSEALPGLFSRAQIREAREAAEAAAEEVLEGEAALPALHASLRLRMRRVDGETAVLSDALLLAAGTVTTADAVRINGLPLGTVEDGEALLAQLQQTIRSNIPAQAAVGSLGGRLQICTVYTRPGLARETAEVLGEILAAAPVFYLDGDGKTV